jgi:transcriptional regulator GlxA family with amidase domain
MAGKRSECGKAKGKAKGKEFSTLTGSYMTAMEQANPSGSVRTPTVVGILIFDDVEVLDFAGPYEVFSVAGRRQDLELFTVYLVAATTAPVLARNRFSVNPHHSLQSCPPLDIIVVPGGYGTRREMHNQVMVDWIAERAARAQIALSVCTGALLFARAQLLEGLRATTHAGAFDLLEQTAPNTRVERDQRVVDNGHVVLSAGVAAGIEASLHVVARLYGRAQAEETARYMEFPWRPESLERV